MHVDVFVVLESRKVPRRMDYYNETSKKERVLVEEAKWVDRMTSVYGPDVRKWNLARVRHWTESEYETQKSILASSAIRGCQNTVEPPLTGRGMDAEQGMSSPRDAARLGLHSRRSSTTIRLVASYSTTVRSPVQHFQLCHAVGQRLRSE